MLEPRSTKFSPEIDTSSLALTVKLAGAVSDRSSASYENARGSVPMVCATVTAVWSWSALAVGVRSRLTKFELISVMLV